MELSYNKTIISILAAVILSIESTVSSVESITKDIPMESSQVFKADPMKQILTKRFSGYSFDSSRPVTRDQIRAIVEAGRLAPSSYNEQPWIFIVCDRTTNPAAYNKAFSTLVEFNQGWAKNAPVLIVSVANSKSAKNGKPNRFAQYDTGAAAFAMMLEATSLGLMSHQMGGFDEEKIRQVFSIPADYVPMSVMAVGYPDGHENKERERKPMSENFYKGAWGVGLD